MVTPRGGHHVSGERHHVLQAWASPSDGAEIPGDRQARTSDGHGCDARHDRRDRRTLLDGGFRDGGQKPRRVFGDDEEVDGEQAVPGRDEGLSRSRGEGPPRDLSARELVWEGYREQGTSPVTCNLSLVTLRRLLPDSRAIPSRLRRA